MKEPNCQESTRSGTKMLRKRIRRGQKANGIEVVALILILSSFLPRPSLSSSPGSAVDMSLFLNPKDVFSVEVAEVFPEFNPETEEIVLESPALFLNQLKEVAYHPLPQVTGSAPGEYLGRCRGEQTFKNGSRLLFCQNKKFMVFDLDFEQAEPIKAVKEAHKDPVNGFVSDFELFDDETILGIFTNKTAGSDDKYYKIGLFLVFGGVEHSWEIDIKANLSFKNYPFLSSLRTKDGIRGFIYDRSYEDDDDHSVWAHYFDIQLPKTGPILTPIFSYVKLKEDTVGTKVDGINHLRLFPIQNSSDIEGYWTIFNKSGISLHKCKIEFLQGIPSQNETGCSTIQIELPDGEKFEEERSTIQVFEQNSTQKLIAIFNSEDNKITTCTLTEGSTTASECVTSSRSLPKLPDWTAPLTFKILQNGQDQLIQLSITTIDTLDTVLAATHLTKQQKQQEKPIFNIINNRGASAVLTAASSPGILVLKSNAYSFYNTTLNKMVIDITPRDIQKDYLYTTLKRRTTAYPKATLSSYRLSVKVLDSVYDFQHIDQIPTTFAPGLGQKVTLPVNRAMVKGNDLRFIVKAEASKKKLFFDVRNQVKQNRVFIDNNKPRGELIQLDMLSETLGLAVLKANGVRTISAVICTPGDSLSQTNRFRNKKDQKSMLQGQIECTYEQRVTLQGNYRFKYLSKNNEFPGVVFFDEVEDQTAGQKKIICYYFSGDGEGIEKGEIRLESDTVVDNIFFSVNGPVPGNAEDPRGNPESYVVLSASKNSKTGAQNKKDENILRMDTNEINGNDSAKPIGSPGVLRIFISENLEFSKYLNSTTKPKILNHQSVGISDESLFCPKVVHTCTHNDRFYLVLNNCQNGDLRIIKFVMNDYEHLSLKQKPEINKIALSDQDERSRRPKNSTHDENYETPVFCPSGDEFHIFDPNTHELYSRYTNDDSSIHHWRLEDYGIEKILKFHCMKEISSFLVLGESEDKGVGLGAVGFGNMNGDVRVNIHSTFKFDLDDIESFGAYASATRGNKAIISSIDHYTGVPAFRVFYMDGPEVDILLPESEPLATVFEFGTNNTRPGSENEYGGVLWREDNVLIVAQNNPVVHTFTEENTTLSTGKDYDLDEMSIITGPILSAELDFAASGFHKGDLRLKNRVEHNNDYSGFRETNLTRIDFLQIFNRGGGYVLAAQTERNLTKLTFLKIDQDSNELIQLTDTVEIKDSCQQVAAAGSRTYLVFALGCRAAADYTLVTVAVQINQTTKKGKLMTKRILLDQEQPNKAMNGVSSNGLSVNINSVVVSRIDQISCSALAPEATPSLFVVSMITTFKNKATVYHLDASKPSAKLGELGVKKPAKQARFVKNGAPEATLLRYDGFGVKLLGTAFLGSDDSFEFEIEIPGASVVGGWDCSWRGAEEVIQCAIISKNQQFWTLSFAVDKQTRSVRVSDLGKGFRLLEGYDLAGEIHILENIAALSLKDSDDGTESIVALYSMKRGDDVFSIVKNPKNSKFGLIFEKPDLTPNSTLMSQFDTAAENKTELEYPRLFFAPRVIEGSYDAISTTFQLGDLHLVISNTTVNQNNRKRKLRISEYNLTQISVIFNKETQIKQQKSANGGLNAPRIAPEWRKAVSSKISLFEFFKSTGSPAPAPEPLPDESWKFWLILGVSIAVILIILIVLLVIFLKKRKDRVEVFERDNGETREGPEQFNEKGTIRNPKDPVYSQKSDSGLRLSNGEKGGDIQFKTIGKEEFGPVKEQDEDDQTLN